MKRALKFLLNVGIYAAIVVGMLFGLPRFLSWYLETPYPMAAITSGSMWPVLHEGDLVFIQGVKREEIKEGDIVVWRNPQGPARTTDAVQSGGFTIHRVVRLGADSLVTKGDANFTEDQPVAYADVVGRTAKLFGTNARLPYFGMVTVYASKK